MSLSEFEDHVKKAKESIRDAAIALQSLPINEKSRSIIDDSLVSALTTMSTVSTQYVKAKQFALSARSEVYSEYQRRRAV